MKKPPAKRNPMAKALANPQYRPRIKPDKRRSPFSGPPPFSLWRVRAPAWIEAQKKISGAKL